MKITFDTIKRFEESTGMSLLFAEDTYSFSHSYETYMRVHGDIQSANYITVETPEGYIKNIEAPEGEVTVEWLTSEINKSL